MEVMKKAKTTVVRVVHIQIKTVQETEESTEWHPTHTHVDGQK